jgi:hypothetical protein
VGRRLLVVDVVPGHGRDNLQHELELGNADVTSAAGEAIVANALAALEAAGSTGHAASAAGWEAAFSATLAAVGLGEPVPFRRPPGPGASAGQVGQGRVVGE